MAMRSQKPMVAGSPKRDLHLVSSLLLAHLRIPIGRGFFRWNGMVTGLCTSLMSEAWVGRASSCCLQTVGRCPYIPALLMEVLARITWWRALMTRVMERIGHLD